MTRMLLLASIAVSMAWAQASTPASATAPGSPARSAGAGIPQQTYTNTIPVFVSGKVAMADGSPVPDSMSIQRVCGVTARTIAYTDRKGHFSFQWGQSGGIIPNASDTLSEIDPGPSVASGGFGPSRTGAMAPNPGTSAGAPLGGSIMSGCSLRVDAPGYRSDIADMDGRRALNSFDVGTLVLHPMSNVEGRSISATSFKAPPDARKAYDRGEENMHKGKAAEAEKDLDKAVSIYPQFASAWVDLGKLRLQSGKTAASREAFAKAIEADDKMVEAHVQLGMIASGERQWAEAVKELDTALRLDPVDFPQAWFADAVANLNAKNFDAAEKSVRESMKVDALHPNADADRLLGLVLASKGNYKDALRELGIYLKMKPDGKEADQVRTQMSQIETLQARNQH